MNFVLNLSSKAKLEIKSVQVLGEIPIGSSHSLFHLLPGALISNAQSIPVSKCLFSAPPAHSTPLRYKCLATTICSSPRDLKVSSGGRSPENAKLLRFSLVMGIS
jgi:hypothetical protein